MQCLGGVVHSSLVLRGKEDRAEELDNDPGWQKLDRFADLVNLCALVYVGRNILYLKRALDASGIKLTSAMTGEFDAGGALTMSRILKLLRDVDDPSEIAREIRTRVFNTVLLGLGTYGSRRDSDGGYTAVKTMLLGKLQPAETPSPNAGGLPSPQAASALAASVQAGLPAPPPATFVAPRLVDDMLGYKQSEVATIAVALLKTRT